MQYKQRDTLEGTIPFILLKNPEEKEIKQVKVFVGAQYNEYNGLFGILEFLKRLNQQNIKEIVQNQPLLFFPLMNPYGFLNPREDNKSGYYLKNGTNLNRYWRRTFVPNYIEDDRDHFQYPIPPHTASVKSILDEYWKQEQILIYIIDFHETSLLRRFPLELSRDLSIDYDMDHWLKKRFIKNVINLFDIPLSEPFFISNSLDGLKKWRLNASLKELAMIKMSISKYLNSNQDKLPFYFCYSNESKVFCLKLASNVYNKPYNMLWKTTIPVVDHNFHDHGCLVKMNDAAS